MKISFKPFANTHFENLQALDIFNKELSYKMFYGVVASILIFAVTRILQKGVARLPEYKRRTLT